MPTPTFPQYPFHAPPPYGYPMPPPPPSSALAPAPPSTPSTVPTHAPSPVSSPEFDVQEFLRSQKSKPAAAAARSATAGTGKGNKRASGASSSAPSKKQKSAPESSTKAKGGKGKGKAKAAPEPTKSAAYSGRQPGSQNYSEEDLESLLDLTQEILPIGQNAWGQVTRRFNEWAEQNGRPPRTQKPLKTKFETMVRTPKPTGNAEIPPHIERAYDIEHSINEKVHTRELDDGEIADEDGEDGEDGDEVEEENSEVEVLDGPPSQSHGTSRPATSSSAGTKPSGKQTVPVLKGIRTDGMAGTSTSTRPTASSRRGQASDFMSAVTTSLDPSLREGRDEARFARRLAQSEFDRLTQDNRDLRARNDALTDRLAQQGAQVHQMALENNRLQSRLDMLEMMQGLGGRSAGPHGRSRYDDWDRGSPRSTPRHSRSYSRSYGQSPRMSPPRTPSSRFRHRDHESLSSHFDHFSPPRPAPRRPREHDVFGPAAGPSSTSTSLSGQFSQTPRNPAYALDTLAALATASHARDDNSDPSLDEHDA
ncbi:hypothetical protein OH76DRAFT_1485628 [Lentinus brumalis]|uniref:DUF6818 domain-containing protein n=1 Tax=Lentinus brumalis TaxID=2498619 RepID=A0A371D1H6_9APHY|nr:hypothetical protein OH76DRAFT_1485628 [Polyporus brumalis]